MLQSAWGRRRRCWIRRASRAISSCRPDIYRDSCLEWALSFDFSPPSTLGYRTGFWCSWQRHSGVLRRLPWEPRVAVFQGWKFVYGVDSQRARDGVDAPPLRLLLGQVDRRCRPPGRLGGRLCVDRRLLVATGRRGSLGCRHDPDRLSRPRRRTSANVQIRPLERLGQLDHREPAGGHQLWLVAKQAHPAPREPQQRGRRPRHRPPRDCDDSGDGHPAPQPAAAVAGRSPGLVLLPAAAARGAVFAPTA